MSSRVAFPPARWWLHSPSKHSLTGIFRMGYIQRMVAAFEVLAESNRRRLLDVLREGEQPVGVLAERLQMSQPSVSKHLRVLKEAGLVEVRPDAQRRLYRIRTEPLAEIDAWLAPYRRLWAHSLDALERRLDATNVL